MIAGLAPPFKWLSTVFRPPAAVLPLARPALNVLAATPERLPPRIADDPVAQKYLAVLGELPWDRFPERPARRPDGGPWPGRPPAPRAPYVAAFLVKLHEHKLSMGALRAYLREHPALVWLLGVPLVAEPTSPWGFDVEASLPSRKQLNRVLRALDNAALQFLLDATIPLVRDALPEAQRAAFGRVVCGDTKLIVAWVRENNPKEFITTGRFDPERPPAGDRDCRIGIKQRRNSSPEPSPEAPPTPARQPRGAGQLQIGTEILWGYKTGLLTTRVGDWCELVLSEQTTPANAGDITFFEAWLADAERRLGFQPPYGAFDTAFDAWYTHQYFSDAGGFAAIPLPETGRRRQRPFDAAGRPCCAAGLGMPLLVEYLDRTTSRHPQPKGRFGCPLLHPTPTGVGCPIDDPHWPKGGCTTTTGLSAGARLRHTLDRQSDAYKAVYRQRTADERLNSQAKALGIERPRLRNQRAITNQNTLSYVLLNLGELGRIRARRAQEEVAPTGT